MPIAFSVRSRIAHLASATIIIHGSNSYWRKGSDAFALGSHASGWRDALYDKIMGLLDQIVTGGVALTCEAHGPTDQVLAEACTSCKIEMHSWPVFTITWDGSTGEFHSATFSHSFGF